MEGLAEVFAHAVDHHLHTLIKQLIPTHRNTHLHLHLKLCESCKPDAAKFFIYSTKHSLKYITKKLTLNQKATHTHPLEVVLPNLSFQARYFVEAMLSEALLACLVKERKDGLVRGLCEGQQLTKWQRKLAG